MTAVFGGTIAVVLLGIYVHLISVAINIVDCVAPKDCTLLAGGFNSLMSQALSFIGGLVSALVIAELAFTKPGGIPVARALAIDASNTSRNILKIVTIVYVLIWLIAGLFAFLKGMYHPTALPALTNVGQAWLGLAVAAAYAYFGLKGS